MFVATSFILAVLSGCQGGPGATSSAPAATTGRCTPQNVRQIAVGFIDAFNRGDLAQLDQLVSDQQFGWYSTNAPGQRLNSAADDRSTLMAYFAARHKQHERLVLTTLDVTFTNATEGGLQFYLTRSADDGLPPTAYIGKGQVQCRTVPSSLIVWSMAPLP